MCIPGSSDSLVPNGVKCGDFDFRVWRVRNVELNRALVISTARSLVFGTCNVPCSKKLVACDLFELESISDRFQLMKSLAIGFA